MQWKGRRKSTNLDDRRGMSGRGKLAAGGGIIAIIVLLLQLFGGEAGQSIAPLLNQFSNVQMATPAQERPLTPEEQQVADFMATVLADTEDIWSQLFKENGLGTYQEPILVLFTDEVDTACGHATVAAGPFYCPADQQLYMDMAFFVELQRDFGAEVGAFTIAYVTAHEIGHHVQTLMGTSAQVRKLQSQVNTTQANKLSVAQELQADFYAGIFAHYEQKYLDEGDIELALDAAQAVGDDNIQRRFQGEVQPDTFTHGTSAQRMQWFLKGYQTGDLRAGDTYTQLLRREKRDKTSDEL